MDIVWWNNRNGGNRGGSTLGGDDFGDWALTKIEFWFFYFILWFWVLNFYYIRYLGGCDCMCHECSILIPCAKVWCVTWLESADKAFYMKSGLNLTKKKKIIKFDHFYNY